MSGFSKDFVWGAATASYQVEGAAFEGGKSLNIWDVFSHEEGKVYDNQNGDVSCDQYHRFPEDIAIMKSLGIQAYRFSVSWARVLPDGTGKVNPEGLAYYDALVDALLAAGITPYMTLYHWDLPYALHLRGGWLNPEIAEWFYEYAKLIGTHFKGRVKNYFTINEMHCVLGLGYYRGLHAPGLKVGKRDFFQIWKNLLLAHGYAVKALRETSTSDTRISYAANGGIFSPASDAAEDIEAAKQLSFEVLSNDLEDASWNPALTSDPIFLGQLPKGLAEHFGQWLPPISREEFHLISQPLDFYAHNIYNSHLARLGAGGVPEVVGFRPGAARTANYWPVTPGALYWAPKFLYERYGKPIVISENGMSSHDALSLDGKVHDPNREDFLHRYLLEYRRAAEDGVDLRGYFEWSLLDNFEWAEGYRERFGIVYVDYATQQRIPKDSAYFYKKIIETNGACL